MSNDVTKLVENALQSGKVELLETLFSALSKTLELRSYQTGEEIADRGAGWDNFV